MLYPRRAVLGLALFIGQAFLYNGVTFNLGTLLSGFYGVDAAKVPQFYVLWALSNFLGPLVLGRLFDTIGRKPMITMSYIGSAVVAVVLGDPLRDPDRRGLGLHRRARRHVLPGIGRRERCLPDRQRNLPDGDPGSGHRVLLCRRHRHRRHQRAAAVRSADRVRPARRGDVVVSHRGGRHGHRQAWSSCGSESTPSNVRSKSSRCP